MNRNLIIATVCAAFAGVPMLVGCDDKKDTVDSKTTTHSADGTTTTDKEKSSVDQNGNGKTVIEHKTSGASTQP